MMNDQTMNDESTIDKKVKLAALLTAGVQQLDELKAPEIQDLSFMRPLTTWARAFGDDDDESYAGMSDDEKADRLLAEAKTVMREYLEGEKGGYDNVANN